MNKISAVIACGGSSTRMGKNKLMEDLNGKSCILRTCEAFDRIPDIEEIIISAPFALHSTYRAELSSISKTVRFVTGGKSRQDSVIAGVLCASGEYVMIHDGARPLISEQEILDCIRDAYQFGSSVLCTPSKDTVRITAGEGTTTPDRSGVYIVRTPQTFKKSAYLLALEEAEGDFTDDAQLLETVGIKPHITIGSYNNIKLTTPEDILTAKAILSQKEAPLLRIGHGYDVHKLVEGRKLILGGVEIPYEKGLLGHSDADVLTHAIMDSMLGALALGDIGKHFPDTDEKYKGADSIELLRRVGSIIKENGYTVANIDATLLAQAPKLSPYIQKMREIIAAALETDADRVSVKATTEEGLGFTGEGLGIAAHAVCLLTK